MANTDSSVVIRTISEEFGYDQIMVENNKTCPNRADGTLLINTEFLSPSRYKCGCIPRTSDSASSPTP